MVSITLVLKLGSLSNDDGDGNEKVKKATGSDWQNNNSARASRLLYIILPSLHDYDVELPISRFMEDVNTRQRFSFSFCELRYTPLKFNSRKNRQLLTN